MNENYKTPTTGATPPHVKAPDPKCEGSGAAPCSVSDEVPFPTSEEAQQILKDEGIDTADLKAWASGKLCEIKGHDWKLTWPLDPCEYTCQRCGITHLH